MDLLAFGGPLNGQVVPVPDGTYRYQAAMERRYPTSLAGLRSLALDFEHEQLLQEEGHWIEPVRIVEYTVERVGAQDASRSIFDERSVWTARCLVAEGFPHHRITDALTALCAVCRLPLAQRGIHH